MSSTIPSTTAPLQSIITSWLPVTSAWSAPPACSSIIWEGYPPFLAANDPGYGIYVDPAVKCLPPAATTWWEQNHSNNNYTSWSIGPITCPSAYTTATTSVQDSSTFVACCPSNYFLDGVSTAGGVGQCKSLISAGQTISIVTYQTISNTNVVASAWVTSISTLQSIATIDGIQMNGWNFVAQTSTTTPTSSTQTSTSSGATVATSAPTTAPSNSSNGTKNAVGIGVGVSLGAVALISVVVGAWWYLRKRKRNQALQDANYSPTHARQEDHGYGAGKPPIPVQEMMSARDIPVHEVEGQTHIIGELYGSESHR